MKVLLLDYLGGHLMRKALMEFEHTLNPFVKNKVRNHFSHSHEYQVTMQDISDRKTHRETQRKDLHSKLRDIDDRLDQPKPQVKAKHTAAPDVTIALGKRKKEIEKTLRQLTEQQSTDEAKTPDPPWILECREFFKQPMKPFVKTDNQWDVSILVNVILGFLQAPPIFASTFPADEFHAKTFLTSIRRIGVARNGRAHQKSGFNETIETDALTAMGQMVRVLRQCKFDVAANNVDCILNEAKALYELASTSSPKPHSVTLDEQDYNANSHTPPLRSSARTSNVRLASIPSKTVGLRLGKA
eukprot:m.143455 g.143455  ORF g.143455 m.143455 type:complete len:300 (+) comp30320_c1_seq1:244-1143(+)